MSEAKFKGSKAHKIKYTINLIPKIGEHLIEDIKHPGETIVVNEGVCVLDLLQRSSELEVFRCSPILDFVDFKWQACGERHQTTAARFHVFYVAVFLAHIIGVYIEALGQEYDVFFLLSLLLGLAYPTLYECV